MTYKSNARMPRPTRSGTDALLKEVENVSPENRAAARAFSEQATPKGLFDVLHAMRRWYSGQTMADRLETNRDALRKAMRLEPEDAIGVYRGFKVPNDHPLARVHQGDELTLDVVRNRGLSSWTTKQEAADRFSGGGKGKTGIVVKLIDDKGVKPLLAPPSHSEPWFNELYERTMGRSYRPTEHEYLIKAPRVKVEVVKVKKAYELGQAAALAHFKLSSAMGANPGVMPRGDEQSHGTDRHQYPARSPASAPDGQDHDMPDWLWTVSDVDHLAPGRADGTYGQEVIG